MSKTVTYVTCMIDEQGHWLDVKYDISGKMNIFRLLSYKSLAPGALILGMDSLLIIKHMYPCYRCYK